MAITGRLRCDGGGSIRDRGSAGSERARGGGGKDGAKSEKPKSEKPSIAAAMGGLGQRIGGRLRFVEAGRRVREEGRLRHRHQSDAQSAIAAPRQARRQGRGQTGPQAGRQTPEPSRRDAAGQLRRRRAKSRRPSHQPRSPVPGSSTPAKPASGFPAPAKPAAASPGAHAREARRGAARKPANRVDDAARQRRPPQHRRIARRAELPPERNDHRHDGAVDHRLDGAVDALRLFPPREHFGRGRQFPAPTPI